jgi:hypothetical protein
VVRSREVGTYVSAPRAGRPQDGPSERDLTLRLDGFAWEAIAEESARLGVSVEELISFSVLYYLADADSGRLARDIAASPYPRAKGQAEGET